MGRERWLVQNTTQKHVNIGDLFKVPTVFPGQSLDLLAHHTHSEITQSNDLSTLLSLGWLRLTKSNVPSSVQLNRIEQDELDAAIAEADPQTVTITSSFLIRDAVIDVILVDATTGGVNVGLPYADTDRKLYIKKIDPTINPVTITGRNGQTIDDSISWEITLQYNTMEVVGAGTSWYIL